MARQISIPDSHEYILDDYFLRHTEIKTAKDNLDLAMWELHTLLVERLYEHWNNLGDATPTNIVFNIEVGACKKSFYNDSHVFLSIDRGSYFVSSNACCLCGDRNPYSSKHTIKAQPKVQS